MITGVLFRVLWYILGKGKISLSGMKIVCWINLVLKFDIKVLDLKREKLSEFDKRDRRKREKAGGLLCVLTRIKGRMCSVKQDYPMSGIFRVCFPSRSSKFDCTTYTKAVFRAVWSSLRFIFLMMAAILFLQGGGGARRNEDLGCGSLLESTARFRGCCLYLLRKMFVRHAF
jgi:hypothetical protein